MGFQGQRIGAMRESLVLQRNDEATSTGTGFRTATWTTYATVPGAYSPTSPGGESFQQSAVVAQVGQRFVIRYRTDVLPKHRVLWRGKVLEIHSVVPTMHTGNRFLELQTGLTQ